MEKVLNAENARRKVFSNATLSSNGPLELVSIYVINCHHGHRLLLVTSYSANVLHVIAGCQPYMVLDLGHKDGDTCHHMNTKFIALEP